MKIYPGSFRRRNVRPAILYLKVGMQKKKKKNEEGRKYEKHN